MTFRVFSGYLGILIFHRVFAADISVVEVPGFHTTASTKNSTQITNINLCVLLEEDSFYVTSYNKVAGALDLAVSNANLFVLPPHLRIQTTFQSAGESCSQVQYSVITNVLRLLRTGAVCDAFVGPGCATTAVSLYGIAEEMNVPIFGSPSGGSSSLSLNGTRTRFPLIIRVPYGFACLARGVETFLRTNNYSHVSLFRDDSFSFFNLASKYLMTYFESSNQNLFWASKETSFVGKELTPERVETLLSEARNRSRVMILLTHAVTVRQFMITALHMGMATGDFVYIAVELYELQYWGRIRFSQGDEDDGVARQAFQSLFVISLLDDVPDSSLNDNLNTAIKVNSRNKFNYTFTATEKLDPAIIGFYESVMIYAQEVTGMAREGLDFHDGSAMVHRIMGREYKGITNYLSIGPNGERDCDFDIKGFDLTTGRFQVVLQFIRQCSNAPVNQTLLPISRTLWFTHGGVLPVDQPPCGFRDDQCKDDSLPRGIVAAVTVIPLLAVLCLATVAGFALIKFRKLRKDYNPNWWKIPRENVTIQHSRAKSALKSKKSLKSQSGYISGLTTEREWGSDGTIVAAYNGALVALNDVEAQCVVPVSDVIIKLNMLKDASHPNLQRFIGLCLTEQGVCQYVVTELCSKGSLTDVLQNHSIKLDWVFKNSLIKDIVHGMAFLHSSPIKSHGDLTSYTCLVDTKFTLKIADFGLPCFRTLSDLRAYRTRENQDRSLEMLLWRAPEHLRQAMPICGTQKGDVYSFAIILQQLILRSGPFELPNDSLDLTDEEILNEVVEISVPPVRPRVPRVACSNEMYDMMERCWEENPVDRPSFMKIKELLKRVIGKSGDNIVDVLFTRMEQYAVDLELKVAEKTQQFMDEKNRSEQLLSQLLPKSVVAALTRGQHVDPEAYESVTIFFSDIVGFTSIAAAVKPMEVVNLLNSLYTFFDSIMEKYDVYKVETIGDAYMVSSGLPIRNGNRHVAEVAAMSLALVEGISLFHYSSSDAQIRVRIGINSGPCVAGIVGLKMPRYCLFGDTVNVASRMESTGEAMRIQITEMTKKLLDKVGHYATIERGPVSVKGKGTLLTYWLIGEAHDADLRS